jgi:predicted Zn finger-like uncharacterized protein
MAQMSQNQIEPLVTECPNCRTRFRVSEAQLQRARGRVRCGACLHVFDGVDHLTPESLRWQAEQEQARLDLDTLLEELGSTASADAPPKAAGSRSGALPEPALFGGYEDADAPGEGAAPTATGAAPDQFPRQDFRQDPRQVDGERPPDAPANGAERDGAQSPDGARPPAEPANAAEPSSALAAAAAGPALEAAAAQGAALAPASEPASEPAVALRPAGARAVERPAFGEPRARRPWLWLAVPALALLLAAQVLWYQFDEWAKQPQWRGVYERICGVIGCELPVRRDAGLLSTRNLAVRSDPEQPGQLLVSTVIVNDADFPQPFPLLELRFTTLRGILVAGRRYQPADYLRGDAAGLELMPPKTPVQIEVHIDDPGPDAVNYVLRLR